MKRKWRVEEGQEIKRSDGEDKKGRRKLMVQTCKVDW